MPLFSQSTSSYLADHGFVVSKTIFEAPRLSMVPSLYEDAEHGKWAIAIPGAEPAIHDYGDIVDCKVVENETLDLKKDISRKDLFESILVNPAAVSRANASRGGKYCTRMDVVLTVADARGGTSTIGIPIVLHEVQRKSRSYELLRQGADAICADMIRMRDLVAGGM